MRAERVTGRAAELDPTILPELANVQTSASLTGHTLDPADAVASAANQRHHGRTDVSARRPELRLGRPDLTGGVQPRSAMLVRAPVHLEPEQQARRSDHQQGLTEDANRHPPGVGLRPHVGERVRDVRLRWIDQHRARAPGRRPSNWGELSGWTQVLVTPRKSRERRHATPRPPPRPARHSWSTAVAGTPADSSRA
jgi:hypothetical protein